MVARFALALCVLLACGCGEQTRVAAPTLPPDQRITPADFDAFVKARTWTSREELLQFFAYEYHAGRRDWEVDAEVLPHLATMSSLFPVAACRAVSFHDGVLRLRLSSAQSVSVPGAFMQASLDMDREIAFHVSTLEKDPESLLFELPDGGWNVKFSWLVKAVAFNRPYVRDFPIRRFEYRIDDHDRGSHVVVGAGQALPRDRIGITRTAEGVAIDLREPEHPGSVDLVLRSDGVDVTCLDIKLRLLDGDLVQWNQREPRHDPALHQDLSWLCQRVLDDPEAALHDGMALYERYTYDLERRRPTDLSFTIDCSGEPAR
jgi:hypothetical protein